MQASELASWFGSILALTAFLQGVLPTTYRDYIVDFLIHLISPHTYFVVPEFDGANTNDLYASIKCYLSNVTAQRARVSNILMAKNAKAITYSLANNQRICDSFNNVRVEWIHLTQERKNSVWTTADSESDERRMFQVRMPYAKKDYLLETYLPYIVEKAKNIARANRDLQLYSNKRDGNSKKTCWRSIPFLHPSTFSTIAIDPELQHSIEYDLEEFIKGEQFYSRVGKAWKRGYLLFGPPGTGKSSVVAAMANKLRYDIFDVELTEVQSNADLRTLLLHTTNKSIVVIEDIDCSLDLSGQRKKKKKKAGDVLEGEVPPLKSKDDDKASKVTLSGLLNFTDGLWSSCGSERIFIFTTNFVDKLEPALLRPGRMDFHIELGYCGFPAFKALARNFLQIKDHELFAEVEKEIQTSFITPAEVAEVFTKHKSNPDLAMAKVIKALSEKKSKPLAHAQAEEEEADSDVEEKGDQQ